MNEELKKEAREELMNAPFINAILNGDEIAKRAVIKKLERYIDKSTLAERERCAEKITPEKLHQWYLEATSNLNHKSFNKNAQVVYDELTDEQKYIDQYISEAIAKAIEDDD